MGYYSDLRISMTKKDYIKMLEKDKKNQNKCRYLLNNDESYIKEYKANNIECILLQNYSLKYYKEFEDIKLFEQYLKETKNGYVFVRIGGSWNDIEYRNCSKIKELEFPFGFIKEIKEETKRELERKKNKEKYSITSKKFFYTDKECILEFYEGDAIFCNKIKKEISDNNIQFKLRLSVNALEKNSEVILFYRNPEQDDFRVLKQDKIPLDVALYFLGYNDEEQFLMEINDVSKEDEEEFE